MCYQLLADIQSTSTCSTIINNTIEKPNASQNHYSPQSPYNQHTANESDNNSTSPSVKHPYHLYIGNAKGCIYHIHVADHDNDNNRYEDDMNNHDISNIQMITQIPHTPTCMTASSSSSSSTSMSINDTPIPTPTDTPATLLCIGCSNGMIYVYTTEICTLLNDLHHIAVSHTTAANRRSDSLDLNLYIQQQKLTSNPDEELSTPSSPIQPSNSSSSLTYQPYHIYHPTHSPLISLYYIHTPSNDTPSHRLLTIHSNGMIYSYNLLSHQLLDQYQHHVQITASQISLLSSNSSNAVILYIGGIDGSLVVLNMTSHSVLKCINVCTTSVNTVYTNHYTVKPIRTMLLTNTPFPPPPKKTVTKKKSPYSTTASSSSSTSSSHPTHTYTNSTNSSVPATYLLVSYGIGEIIGIDINTFKTLVTYHHLPSQIYHSIHTYHPSSSSSSTHRPLMIALSDHIIGIYDLKNGTLLYQHHIDPQSILHGSAIISSQVSSSLSQLITFHSNGQVIQHNIQQIEKIVENTLNEYEECKLHAYHQIIVQQQKLASKRKKKKSKVKVKK